MAVIKTPLNVTGNSIRVMRVVRGFSQRRLGEKAGVKPWRLFQIEHHVVEPTEAEVARLLGALSTEG